jgi:hypothetical protein
MSAKNLFIACGLHASSITEEAAEELLAYNKDQNKGLYAKGMEHGEHVPTWTNALATGGDGVRLCRWVLSQRAHGAGSVCVQPVNGFTGAVDVPLLLETCGYPNQWSYQGRVVAFYGQKRGRKL